MNRYFSYFHMKYMYTFTFLRVFHSTVKDRLYSWLNAREWGKHAGQKVLWIHFTCLPIDVLQFLRSRPLRKSDGGNIKQPSCWFGKYARFQHRCVCGGGIWMPLKLPSFTGHCLERACSVRGKTLTTPLGKNRFMFHAPSKAASGSQ